MGGTSPKGQWRNVFGAVVGALACLAVVAGVGVATLVQPASEDARDTNWKFDDPVAEAVATGKDAATVQEIAAQGEAATGESEAPDFEVAYDAAGNPYADKELLVELDGAVDEAGLASLLDNEGAHLTGASLVSKALDDNGVLVEVRYEGERAPQDLGNALAGAASVRGVELNYLQELCDVDEASVPVEASDDVGVDAAASAKAPTNDAELAEQWGLEAVGAFEAWDIAKSDRKVTVAVIDSGVLCSHEDLADNIVSSYAKNTPTGKTGPAAADDCMGHGTHVSGIIAAVANNGKGTAGVSYNANVLPVRAWKEAGKAKNSDVIKGLDYVTSLKTGSSWDTSKYGPIRVINMSLGGYSKSSNYQSAITRAYNAGILVVASAGNDSTDDTHYPSAYDHVLAVTALEEDGGSGKFDDSYSNFGSNVDLAAPGSHIYSTTFDGAYYYKSGTSMATPMVSGAAALVAAAKPSLSPDEIEDVLESTAEDKGSSGWDERYGHGALQLNEAVKKITPCTLISAADISGIDAGGYAFTGSAVEPAIVLKHGGATLKEGLDYTLEYSNNVNAGTATITVKGRAKFTGARAITFAIKPANLASVASQTIPDCVFTGEAQEPAPSLEFNGRPLRERADFDVVSFADNVNAGTARLVVRGKGNFTGTRTLEFAITPASMSDVAAETIADRVYTGSAQEPDPAFLFGARTLVKGEDFDVVSRVNNVNVGTGSVTVRGKGNYSGERTVEFEITQAIFSSVHVEVPGQAYTGSELRPEPVVSYQGRALVKGVDYEIVSYADNVSVGAGTVAMRGKGNFAGERTDTFAIWSSSMDNVVIEAISDQVYTGEAQEPEPVLWHNGSRLVKDVDYEIDFSSYANNVNVGTATVTARGMGSFEGECSVPFKIVPAGIESVDIAEIPDRVFTGEAQEPDPELSFRGVTLEKGVDFDVVSCEDNVNAGTARITVAGLGNFTGERTVEFRISCEDLSSAEVAEIPARTFTGEAQEPEPALSFKGVDLVKGVDYDIVAYENNINFGTARIVVQGKGAVSGAGNFTGERTVEFSIAQANIADVEVAEIPEQVYTGEAQEPEPKLVFNGHPLVKGIDFSIESYANNVDIGTATITIMGWDNFTGARTVEFGIARIDVANVDVAAVPDRVFTGAAHEPDPALSYNDVDLVRGVDFEVSYKDNINAGEGRIVVSGKGSFEGEREIPFSIARADCLSDGVDVKVPDQVYTGEAQEPEPVFLFKSGKPAGFAKGSGYVVSYEDNTDAGKARVTVSGMGNFTGTRTVEFNIAPADLSSVDIEVPGQFYTGKALEPEPTLRFGGSVLVRDDDYDVVSYKNNVNAGMAKVTVCGIGNFTGTRTVEFAIARIVSMNNTLVTAEPLPDRVFTGLAQEPEPTLSFNGRALVRGVDYDVIAFENNVDAGAARVIVRGKGDFTGARAVPFKILPAAQSLQLKVKTKSVSASKTKRAKQVIKGAVALAGKVQGDVSFARVANGSSAQLTVNKKDGAITVKKGTASGTYRVKVMVSASGNRNYEAASKVVTVKVKVKKGSSKSTKLRAVAL